MRFVCLALFAFAGCGGSGDAACAATSLDTVQTRVFDGCASFNSGCHSSAPPFGANLNLTRGMAYGYLVHAPSNSSPGNWRVEPDDLDHSFLWRKLTNDIAQDGTEGVPMPRDANDHWASLPQAQLDAVRCWITSGAPQ
jgi:hypothetical protein